MYSCCQKLSNQSNNASKARKRRDITQQATHLNWRATVEQLGTLNNTVWGCGTCSGEPSIDLVKTSISDFIGIHLSRAFREVIYRASFAVETDIHS